MKRLVVVQSLIIVTLIMVGFTIHEEKMDVVKDKERVESEFATWKNQYKSKLNELDQIIKSNTKVEEKEIVLASLKGEKSKIENTLHYYDWKKRVAFVKMIVEDSKGKFKEPWAYFMYNKAHEVGLDPYIVYRLIDIETGGTFNPNLVGPDTKYGNARGLGQIMHSNTAEWVASMAGLEYEGKEKLFDPYYSIELTITYLDFLYNHYGNWNEVLTAYNRGMYGLEQYKEKTGHAKSTYAVTILEGINQR